MQHLQHLLRCCVCVQEQARLQKEAEEKKQEELRADMALVQSAVCVFLAVVW